MFKKVRRDQIMSGGHLFRHGAELHFVHESLKFPKNKLAWTSRERLGSPVSTGAVPASATQEHLCRIWITHERRWTRTRTMSKRLLGATLPARKKLWVALQNVYGIGASRARALCFEIGATSNTTAAELGQFQLSQLLAHIESNYVVANDLRDATRSSVQRLVDIRCYRGLRHVQRLPVRGQRTHTNARTQKKLPLRY